MKSAEDCVTVRINKGNRRKTVLKIAVEVNGKHKNPISITTLKWRLGKAGLRGRIAVRKPLLRKQNKQKRYDWAQAHKNWTIENWKKVLWSHESKYEVYGHADMYLFEGRQENKCRTSTVSSALQLVG
ncbi:hypothetical protein Trydic_g13200 [Trypoxylus dichotomus]